MAKETFYFSHDYGARNDPKLQKVLMKLGHEGKSVYWDLVEMLYEEGGYLLINECENYAFALRTDAKCITSLINDFDLFGKNDVNFWSSSVLGRLDLRDQKSKKASESAKKRWDKAKASNNDAIASNFDAIKESKVKESKGNDIITPAVPAVPIDFVKFIDGFNGFANRSFRVTEKVKTALRSRLKKYTKIEIMAAIATAHKDQYHIDTKFKHLTPEFILREDKLEKFLNQQTSTEPGKSKFVM
jgi:hypothetical protein